MTTTATNPTQRTSAATTALGQLIPSLLERGEDFSVETKGRRVVVKDSGFIYTIFPSGGFQVKEL